MDRSPATKKQMTQVGLETKLYQGARAAGKNGWKSSAKKNRMKRKRKPVPVLKLPSSSEDSSESEVECVGVSPAPAPARAPSPTWSESRLIRAREAALGQVAKKLPRPSPMLSRSNHGALSGPRAPQPAAVLPQPQAVASLLSDIKADNLNQARSVKRHTTSALGGANKEVFERLSAQDGILNQIHNDMLKIQASQVRTKKVLDDILTTLEQCPHSNSGGKGHGSSPNSLGSVSSGTNGSVASVATAAGNQAAGRAVGAFTINHHHTYYQRNTAATPRSSNTSRMANPYKKKPAPPNSSCNPADNVPFNKKPPPSSGNGSSGTDLHGPTQFGEV